MSKVFSCQRTVFSRFFFTIGCVLVVLAGFFSPAAAAGPLQVFTSVPPHAFLAERLGKGFVEATALISPGQDPHTFEATPRQIVALSGARAFFATGLPVEKRLLAKVRGLHNAMVIVDIAAGIEQLAEQGDEHGGGHAEPDPHIWLSPPLLRMQINTMAAALVALLPERAQEVRANEAELVAALRGVEERLRLILKPFAGRTFYVFHPAFGYFGQAFGLHQEAVEMGGSQPSPRQLAALVQRAQQDGVKVIFTQPQFDQRSAAVIASAMKGAVVSMDPMAPDVLNNFSDMAKKLESAFQRQ